MTKSSVPLIAVICDPLQGGHFLCWSLHWLAGDSVYYSITSRGAETVPDNPLLDQNSHNFLINDVVPDSVNDIWSDLGDWHRGAMSHIHCHPYYEVGFDADVNPGFIATVTEQVQHGLMLVNTKTPLYNCKYHARFAGRDLKQNGVLYPDSHEKHEDFVKVFFADSDREWRRQGLEHPWDLREFYALNLRQFWQSTALPYFDSDRHYLIESSELWCYMDNLIVDIMRTIGIDIRQERWASWLPVYHRWRQFHQDQFRFDLYFDHIVRGILLGHDIDLTRFQLDIMREAAIQHELIYHHDLNLRTWQLEKFTNTRQLHHLLEPNHHPIQKYQKI